MAGIFVQLLAPTVLGTGFKQTNEQAQDLGSQRVLELQFDVLTVGSGAGGETVGLEHSATRDGKYLPVNGGSIVIDSTAQSQHKTVANFLRFVKVSTAGTVVGSPVVGIAAIAKE